MINQNPHLLYPVLETPVNIKRIKVGYRKAIDTGHRSDGGKVVLALYQEWQDIQAGSLAIASIDEGIKCSTKLDPAYVFCDSQNSPLGSLSNSSSGAENSSSDSQSLVTVDRGATT